MRTFAFVALACPALAFQGIHTSEEEIQLGLSDGMGMSDFLLMQTMPQGPQGMLGQLDYGRSGPTYVPPQTQGWAAPAHVVQRQRCQQARLPLSFDPEGNGNRIGYLYYSEALFDPYERDYYQLTSPGFGVCNPTAGQAYFRIGLVNGKYRAFHRPDPYINPRWHLSYCDLSVDHCMSLEEWGGSTPNSECGDWYRSNPDYNNHFGSETLRWRGCVAQCRSLLIETDHCAEDGFEFHDNLELPNGASCDTHCDSDEGCFECASRYCNPQSECGRQIVRFMGMRFSIPDGIDPDEVNAIMDDQSLSMLQKMFQITNLEPVTTFAQQQPEYSNSLFETPTSQMSPGKGR